MKQSKRNWKNRNTWATPTDSSPACVRAKRRAAIKRKLDKLPPPTIDLKRTVDGFEAQVFFNTGDLQFSDLTRVSNLLEDSIKQLTTGRFKIRKHRFCSYRKTRFIKSVLLENGSDVLILMMCHREYVKKIHNFKENEAPEGASLLSSSCFNDCGSFPEMLTSVA